MAATLPVSVSPYVGLVLIVGLLVAAALAVAYVYVVVLRMWIANRWGPIKRAEARVVRKAPREYDRDLTPLLAWISPFLAMLGAALHYGIGLDIYSDWNFWVTFAVGDAEMDFRVREKLYQELEEGMEGVLTYRGERLLRFALGSISKAPQDHPDGTPAERDEAAPWTPGRRIERKG